MSSACRYDTVEHSIASVPAFIVAAAPSRVEPYLARGVVVGDHGHDGVGIDGGILRRGRPSRAARDQVVRFRLAAIPHRNREACIEIAAGHPVAHASKTDERDPGHWLIHVLDRAGRGAERALRQRRGHEFVEVAVEHARRCPDVCTPVRRSFTI